MAATDHLAKSARMLASIAVIVAALYVAKGVLVPITLAVLLSFLLSPVCDWLERHWLGRVPAVMVTALVGFTVFGGATWMAVVQVSDLAPKMPEYETNLKVKLQSANAYVGATLGRVTRTAQGMSENLSPAELTQAPQGTKEWPYAVRIISSPASPLQVFGSVFGTVLQVLGSVGVVIILVVFFLVRRDDLRDRFILLVGQGEVSLTTQVLEDAGTRVSRYLAAAFLVNSIYGTAVGVGLYLIGVPNPTLWGILATTLRFIPYLGPWLAAAMPIGLSMAISGDWMAPGLTIGLFVVLELVTNNALEPWLYGKNTGVSAVAVLLAAVFWTWLWGVVGLLLATPLTVCLLVVGKRVPQLSFLNTLLGDKPVFEPTKRVYQRLLAGDDEEAAELLEKYFEHAPLVEVYDTVLIPALGSAETHWRRGEIEETRHTFILQTLKSMIQERGERKLQPQQQAGNEDVEDAQTGSGTADRAALPGVRVLCLPAHGEADELAAMMLAQIVDIRGCVVETVPAAAMGAASELVEYVGQSRADVVCISAVPPAAVTHARRLRMRLRRRFPELNLVVGLWNSPDDLNEAKERVGSDLRTQVVATLADAQAQIRRFVA
ncbi:MAG: AI-2E family transporter [Steroidobacteraceae bacterium]|nr:AI-2E family transporter [Pseudomonadota bacterium]MBP9130367.1 AI-2E family transporter [Steroidobacteraceae bacterium]